MQVQNIDTGIPRIVGVKEYVPEPSKTLQEWMEEREVSGTFVYHACICVMRCRRIVHLTYIYIYSVIATYNFCCMPLFN